MASATAFDTIEQHLRDEWGATTPIVFENEPYDLPDVPAPFLFVEIVGSTFGQASLGNGETQGNLWREAGYVEVHVMTPNDTGSRAARVYADRVVDIFRGQEIGPVTFGDASVGSGDPGRAFAGYFAFTATLDWERDQ